MEVTNVTQQELQTTARRLKDSGARLITIVGTDAGANLEVFISEIELSETFKYDRLSRRRAFLFPSNRLVYAYPRLI
jgi:hypothetical protein